MLLTNQETSSQMLLTNQETSSQMLLTNQMTPSQMLLANHVAAYTCYSCWLGSQRKLLTGSWCCSAGCCSSACRDIYTAILERLLFKMEGAKRQRACALPRYRPVVEAVVAALRWRSWLGGAKGRLRGWRRDLRRLKSKNECTVGVHTELLSIVQYTFTVHYFAQGF